MFGGRRGGLSRRCLAGDQYLSLLRSNCEKNINTVLRKCNENLRLSSCDTKPGQLSLQGNRIGSKGRHSQEGGGTVTAPYIQTRIRRRAIRAATGAPILIPYYSGESQRLFLRQLGLAPRI